MNRKKKNIKIIFIIFFILLLVTVIIVYTEMNDHITTVPYETNYTEKVGINGYFKDIVKKFGEPIKMMTDNNGLPLAIYHDFELHLMGKTNDDSSVAVVGMISSKYKFGKNNITIGSSKIDVVRSYTSAGKYTFISCDGDPKVYHANDKGYVLTFYFDDKDNVSKIEFYWQGDYWTTHW